MSDHPHVQHPRRLIHKQPGLKHQHFTPPGLGFLARTTSRLAFLAAALYGAAATILVFLIYSVLSGLAKGNLQLTLLTWSNGVQLVFCAVMTYVGNQLAKQGQAKSDADHQALTHIAHTGDETRKLVEAVRSDIAGLADTIRDARTLQDPAARRKTPAPKGM